ncbi:unnamed protein product [Rotaria magnacalcarata]|uniref:Apple domain-containing protein n=1 Tax=Rotaria magnacalcarata TaxID=392030 RepID=A0A816NAQ8_9BILA|nr:unnamed protein product [Rotaria magnacalcarata]
MVFFIFVVIAMSSPAHAIYSSTLSLRLQGHEFQPQYGVQLIFNETAESILLCSVVCNQNPSCHNVQGIVIGMAACVHYNYLQMQLVVKLMLVEVILILVVS